jgi:hypothetical protein
MNTLGTCSSIGSFGRLRRRERLLREGSFGLGVAAAHRPHLLGVLVVLRERRVDRTQRDVQLVRDVGRRVFALHRQFVDVEHADTSSVDSWITTEDVVRAYDLGHTGS